MNIKQSLAKFLSRGRGNPVVETTAEMFPGFGQKGAKSNPFMRDTATKSFASWVYIAAMLNANAFAAVPLRLYVRKRSAGTYADRHFRSRAVSRRAKHYLRGSATSRKEHPSKYVIQKIAEFGDDFEEVTTPHPALQLLSQVNPWQNGYELAALRLLYLQLMGNAYIYPMIDTALDRPVELWPMPSQYVSVIPDRDGLIGGYTYGRSPDLVEFDRDEVMRWSLPSLDDPYYGMSKTQAAWSGILISKSKGEIDRAFLDNMGRPDWLLLAKTGGDTANLDRLEAQVDGKLRGRKNSGRFLVAGGDVSAVQLNFAPTEFGDQDRVIEEIAGVFGVPISKLLANDPNRANAETGDAGWMRDTILPYCRMDEETLNAFYLPLFGIEGDAVLAYDNPVPINEQAEITRLNSLVAGNVLVPNEARAELGYEEAEWGNVPLAELTKADPFGGLFGSLTGNKPAADAPALPAAEPTDGAPSPSEAPPAATDANTAAQQTQLNGAQVASFMAIVVAVVAGELPRDSGVAMLQQLFGLTQAQADAAMGSAGKSDVPTTPNPVPTPEPAPVVPPVEGEGEGEVKSIKDDEPKTINATPTGKARGLPDGAKLIPPLVKMFGEQRKAVLAKFKGKSLADIENEYAAAIRSIDPDALAENADPLVIHAVRRGTVKRSLTVRQKDGPGTDRPEDAPPPPALPTSFVPLDEWTIALADECRPLIETIMRDEGKKILTRVGASDKVFAVFEQNIPTAAQDATMKFCQATNETTSLKLDNALSQLRDEVQVGLVSGDTYKQLEDRVNAIFDEAEQSRAERIARTEGSRATHTGELIGAKDSGVVSRKSWLASTDACPICEKLAAIGAVPLTKAFAEFGGEYGTIDGPPAHPHCVCSLTFDIED